MCHVWIVRYRTQCVRPPQIKRKQSRMKTYAQSIEQARKQVDQVFQRSDFATMLSRSTTGILGMIFAIQDGQDWAKRAVDEEGQPLLTPAEQEVWTATCEPYLPFFRGWQRVARICQIACLLFRLFRLFRLFP